MDSKAIHTLQYLQPHRFFGDRLSQIPLMNQTWTSAVSGFNRSSGRVLASSLFNAASKPLVQTEPLLGLTAQARHHPILVCLIVFAFGTSYLLFRYWDCAIGCERRSDLKGPKGLPLIGNLLWALKNHDPLSYQVYAQHKYGYGNTHSLPGLGRLIDISRPDWIEHVQKTKFANYVKGEQFHDQMRDVLGDGIFTSDGERWKMQRKVASRIFTVSSFKAIITHTIREDCKLVEKLIESYAKEGTVFNLQELYFKFTLSSFVKIAFSQDIMALSEPGRPDTFGDAFNYAQKVLDMRFVQPWWKIAERFSETGKKMRAARKIVEEFSNSIVESRRSETEAMGEKAKPEGSRKDLLDLFMAYRSSDGQGLSNQQLKDTILNLMIAGRDTTAEALSWMSWHMLTKPDVYSSIREEIDASLHADGQQEGLEIDYDVFEQHTAKLTTFHETLRLHPSIPKNIRRALQDDVLPNGGPRVRKGDLMLYSDWAMARNPEIWGPDACEFKPSRWMDEKTGSTVKYSQFQAHFFNGGPRLCLGQKLASYEVVQLIHHIFAKFDLELVDLGPKKSAGFDKVPDYLNSLTHPMKRPLMVRATIRARNEATP
ncbi:related to Cytochrome P450 [Sporisorium scitamineum]|uniref:Related to Cytochrome P450 n=2 Tax=Sporisorium scitamineum TaxID=49012 RepID=A0A127ZG42_9BASI|nr:related to Cytochrome P450 [Sporisorium scitamineum]